MNRRTRKTAQHEHAKQRAEERYGITLSKKARREIVQKILNNKSVVLESSLTRSIHLVNYEGQAMKVVFSVAAQKIITVLPNKLMIDQMFDDYE